MGEPASGGTTAEKGPPSLPRIDGAAFLRRMIACLRSLAAYPAGHVQIRRAFEGWEEVLRRGLAERDPLEVTVERERVLVAGIPVESDDPMLARFRDSLRRRGVRVLRFRGACDRAATEALAEALAADPRGAAVPVSDRIRARAPRGIEVEDLVYHAGGGEGAPGGGAPPDGTAGEAFPAAEEDLFGAVSAVPSGEEPDAVLDDPEVQVRLEEARRRFTERGAGADGEEMVDALPLLLSDIREALIEEGVYSESEVRRLLLETLRHFGSGDRPAKIPEWLERRRAAPVPAPSRPEPRTLRPSDPTLAMLPERDRQEILRSLLSAEGAASQERLRREMEAYRPEADFTRLLLELLLAESGDEMRRAIGGRLRAEVERALVEGDGTAAWDGWRWVFQGAGMLGDRQAALRSELEGLPTERWVEVVLPAVRADDREDLKAFRGFAAFLGKGTLTELLPLYFRLEDAPAAVLAEGLAAMGSEVLDRLAAGPGPGDSVSDRTLALLAAFDGPSAEAFYRRILGSSTPARRDRVYARLAERRDTLGTGLLLEGLRGSRGRLRLKVLELLGQSGGPGAVEGLAGVAVRRHLFHRSSEERIAAIQALERIADPSAAPALRRIVESRAGFPFGEDPRVQSWAAFALQKIGAAGGTS